VVLAEPDRFFPDDHVGVYRERIDVDRAVRILMETTPAVRMLMERVVAEKRAYTEDQEEERRPTKQRKENPMDRFANNGGGYTQTDIRANCVS
jgi:hypothetical protein